MRNKTTRTRRPATILFPTVFAALGMALIAAPTVAPAIAAPDHGKQRYEKRSHRDHRDDRRDRDHHRYRDDRRHRGQDHSYRSWKHRPHDSYRHGKGHAYGHWKKSHRHYVRPHASHVRPSRYQRHHDRFVIPQRIVRSYDFEPYYHGRVYHAGHRHHHRIYRFPVYTDSGWRHRLHHYCGADLYTTGSFVIHGDRFSLGFNW